MLHDQMDVLDKTLLDLEKELWEILPSIEHPRLKQLLTDIASIRRTKELVGVITIPNRFPNKDGLTRGSAIYEVLRKSPGRMHVKHIVTELAAYGFDVSVSSAVGIMKKDHRKRFKPLGKSFYDLTERYNESSDTGSDAVHSQPALASGLPSYGIGLPYYGNGHGNQNEQASENGNGNGYAYDSPPTFRPIKQLGMTLKQAIILVLDEFDGELSQQDVYSNLVERFPKAAPGILRTTVSVTLNKLAKAGVLEEVFEGYGRHPKRYRRVKEQESAKVV